MPHFIPLPDFGNIHTTGLSHNGHSAQAGDLVWLISCLDTLADETSYDVWYAPQSDRSFSEIVADLNLSGHGCVFTCEGIRKLQVDEKGNFCVDVEGGDLSDAFKQAIMAVAKI